ncbi:MAG: metallophosphoesterase family protein [Candidatus Hydrogenedentes bacterium]|nr:metallophosphoesterase family protein [Candidatus Hydrogenedentota bacterium]
MKRSFFRNSLLKFGILIVILVFSGCITRPTYVYLTWQNDPHTTITVNTLSTVREYPIEIRYRELNNPNSPENILSKSPRDFTITEPHRKINTFELTELKPGEIYTFTLKTNKGRFTKELKFRTIPNDGKPLRFVVGGDMGILPSAPKLLKQAQKLNPQFVVIGGDIVYENGDPNKDWMWDIWLKHWTKYMIDNEDCLIPLIAGIGNHEVNEKDPSHPSTERAPFYFNYLAQCEKTYFYKKFEPHLLLILLDSNHIVSISDQVNWLNNVLEQNSNYPFIIPVYHVPMYPSHRPFDGAISAEQRKLWLPIFDKYRVSVAFENHDHTFKRTKSLRNGVVSSEGTVYLGDGCFGVSPREIKNHELGYLEKASGIKHFWLVEIDSEKLTAKAVDIKGKVFDEVIISPR